MIECSCGTVSVPLTDKLPRGWTAKENGKYKYLCPLCSMVEAVRKRKEGDLH